ncbi:hypothetical protein FVB32_09285 [Flagellimonas hymeniacidonis]|uniref:Uncharacterized protein n=1 Tax=Flagellimonas hymeniacidonis TaxID=2603628 RepID=A0A5C8V0E9_9FLAO|nr:hypothetical protein [Flagellimonas hymeniacidonis]TXN34786.1 hypothetical protein FVB32_09285 [Flagellimonas hymeniacidonis]
MKTFLVGITSFFWCIGLIAQQSANVQPGVVSSYQKGLQGIGPDFGNNPASENFYNQMRDKLANMGIEQRIALDDIEGSIYLNEDFVLGKVFFNTDEEAKMYLRYNAFNDEFEIKKTQLEEEVTRALLKSEEISCSLGNNTYNYFSLVNEKGEKSMGYLKTIYTTTNYKLLEQRNKLFKEGKQAKTSHAVSFPHRFVDETNYYISVDGSAPVYVSSKKKELIFLFKAEHQEEVKGFLKKKNIDLKSKDGLINLVAFSGTL